MKEMLRNLIWLMLFMALPAMAAEHDLVINNGRVMDPETMLDAKLDGGVKDGRIAIITKDAITGRETINAKGLVVAPGFIDTHFHPMGALGVCSLTGYAREGITT